MSPGLVMARERVTARISSRQLRSWSVPVFFAVLAVVGTGESVRLIVEGDTSEARWGGWYLLVVSALVAIGALARPQRPTVPPAVAVPDPDAARMAADDGPRSRSHSRDALIFFVAAVGFAWALPWVGFAVANGLFVAVYLVWVAHRRWWVALVAAVLVDACLVVGLNLLDVLLPTGVIGFGF